MTDAVRELCEAFKVAAHYMGCYHEHFPRAGAWFKEAGDCGKEAERILAAIESQAAPEVCKWEEVKRLEVHRVGCRPGALRDGHGFTYCPDCGRKIEVTP